MTRLMLATLAFYKRWLSPALHSLNPGGCRYLPTCSDYAATAIAIHGPLRGSALALSRLLRCHPFARGGLDPVPPAAAGQHDFRGGGDRTAASGGEARPFPSKPLP